MTQYTNTEFKSQTAALFPTNGIGAISAEDLRTQFNNMADSVPFKLTGATVAPTVTDDGIDSGGNGAFEVGDVWVDETSNVAYMCLDSSTGAAVWVNIGSTSGAVNSAGTPANNQLAIWTAADTIEGDANITWDGATLAVSGSQTVSGDLTATGNVIGHADIITVSASRVLALTDRSSILEVDTALGAVTLTIPTNATVAFPIGTIINVTLANATNTATIAAAVGVSINGVGTGSGAITATQWVGVSLYKRATNDWVAQGQIGTIA